MMSKLASLDRVTRPPLAWRAPQQAPLGARPRIGAAWTFAGVGAGWAAQESTSAARRVPAREARTLHRVAAGPGVTRPVEPSLETTPTRARTRTRTRARAGELPRVLAPIRDSVSARSRLPAGSRAGQLASTSSSPRTRLRRDAGWGPSVLMHRILQPVAEPRQRVSRSGRIGPTSLPQGADASRPTRVSTGSIRLSLSQGAETSTPIRVEHRAARNPVHHDTSRGRSPARLRALDEVLRATSRAASPHGSPHESPHESTPRASQSPTPSAGDPGRSQAPSPERPAHDPHPRRPMVQPSVVPVTSESLDPGLPRAAVPVPSPPPSPSTHPAPRASVPRVAITIGRIEIRGKASERKSSPRPSAAPPRAHAITPHLAGAS